MLSCSNQNPPVALHVSRVNDHSRKITGLSRRSSMVFLASLGDFTLNNPTMLDLVRFIVENRDTAIRVIRGPNTSYRNTLTME